MHFCCDTTAFLGENNKILVLELWKQLAAEKDRIIPSYVTVMKVLNACLHYNDGDTALEIMRYLWKVMDDLGGASLQSVLPKANEARIYSYVLAILYREGRTEDCFKTLASIRERGVQPSQLMYR